MTEREDEPDLLPIAEAVTDGRTLDWRQMPESRGLAGLKLIEQVSAAYRDTPPDVAPPADPVLAPGTELGGYSIEGVLGRGGMGVVYLARDTRLGRHVALKTLPPGDFTDARALARLSREARLLASIDHPGIAVIHGLANDPHGIHLVMERVNGVTLAERLRSGALPLAETLTIATGIAEALQAAHEGGVVHRDLKPGNVMITTRGKIKVLDFGVAVLRRAPAPAAERSLDAPSGDGATSSVIGTPGYASPEQIRGLGDERADVFAFGAVLYECLAGVPAFPGATVGNVLTAVLERDPDLGRLPPDTPDALRQLVTACLARDPARRLGGMQAVLGVLARLRAPGGGEIPLSSTPNNLLSDRTRFVGRGELLDELAPRLAPGALITLTGPGGVGKTRLALRLARLALDHRPGGVWFVDLAAVGDAARLPLAVASALGVREQPGMPLGRTLLERLRDAEACLVLDNCEHVLEACRTLVATLREGCERLAIVTTSREPLGLGGEQVVPVPPLEAPARDEDATPGALIRHPAVELFVDRAELVTPDFELNSRTASAVAEICRAVEGLPLAIELAAARLHVLSVEEIALRLDRLVGLLRAEPGTVSRRHATLRATLDWSVEALEPAERRAFRAFAAFASAWDLPAACAVLGADEFTTLDLVGALTRRSLLVTERRGESMRYRFLEPVRQFAAEQLAASGEDPLVRARFVAHAVSLAETAEPALLGAEQPRWLDRLDLEHENLMAALDACARLPGHAESALRIAGSLWRFWHIRGHLRTGAEAVRRALALPGAEAAGSHRARALYAAGALAAFDMGGQWRAREFFEEALASFRALGDRFGTARCLTGLGAVASGRREFASGAAYLEEAQAIYRQLGDRRGLAVTLNNLGAALWNQGKLAQACTHITEALGLARGAGDLGNVAQLAVAVTMLQVRLGEAEPARAALRECLSTLTSLGARHSSAAGALLAAGELAVLEGRHRDGACWFGAADTVLQRIGLVFDAQDVWWQGRDASLGPARATIGDAAVDEAYAGGVALDCNVALKMALDGLGA